MANSIRQYPVGVSYPLTMGTNGYFKQDFDNIDAIKSSIRLLLATVKGERRMNPLYGSGIWNYIFNNIDNISEEVLTDILTKDVDMWIPNVSIKSINVIKNNINIDTYRIELIIDFTSTLEKNNVETMRFVTDILKN